MEIIDISASGVKFSCGHSWESKINDEIKLSLRLGDKRYEVDARIVRTDQGKHRRKIEYVAVQFLKLRENLQDELARAIREIERHLRYKQMLS